ncbi:hypothetical protein ABBQ38_000364 [Trebouxia sp. C0009 RCD-2024]
MAASLFAAPEWHESQSRIAWDQMHLVDALLQYVYFLWFEEGHLARAIKPLLQDHKGTVQILANFTGVT